MRIKDVLAKVSSGGQLTDDEKAFLADEKLVDSELNARAVEARKKFEAEQARAQQELATAQARLAEIEAAAAETAGKGKSELQKMQEQLAKLTATVETTTREKAALIRQQKLDDVIRGSGLQFVPDVDGGIMRGALVKEFEGLPDDALADADKVKPIINTFRARNKAVILDTSGHGAGGPAHQPGPSAEDRAKRVEAMTPEERKADLKKNGVL